MGCFKHIRHTFPVKGHSYLPNDRDFGKTEKKKQKMERVYVPEQWADIIRSACKKQPFVVHSVTQAEVFDFTKCLSTYLKKTVTSKSKEKLRMRSVRILDYSKEHVNEVWAKYSMKESDSRENFVVEKCSVKRIAFPQAPAYTAFHPLKPAKIADLRKIVNNFVPEEYKMYYQQILSACESSETYSGQESGSSDTESSND